MELKPCIKDIILDGERQSKAVLMSEAIRLRTIEKLSLKAIAAQLSIAKSTASIWLRDYPLDEKDKHDRYVKAGLTSGERVRKKIKREEERSTAKSIVGNWSGLSTSQKGKVAEAAVTLRLALLGKDVYKSMFDGDKVDIITLSEANKPIKIQVKWASYGKHGEAVMKLTCSNGRRSSRKYIENEFDMIVGYNASADQCHCFTFDEVKGNNFTVSCSTESVEAWHKINI